MEETQVKKRLAVLVLVLSVILSFVFPAYATDAYGNSFQLSSTSVSVKIGQTTQIGAVNGSLQAFGVIWSSGDESIAKVDSDGNVTGVNWGQAPVTANFPDGTSAQCMVNVAQKGIDISEHQTSVDWSAVKGAGYDFAMIRTGYGGEDWANQTDKNFETFYGGATAAGLRVGVYHYSYATSVAMADQEANMCLSILNGRSLDLPVAFDVEDKSQWGVSSDTLGAIVQTFCSKVQAAGYKTVVYSYPTFYNSHLTSSLVSQYDTWIASTGGVSKPSFDGSFTMWQYGQTLVPGVQGSQNNMCDVDYCYSDYSGTAGSGINQPSTPSDPNQFQSDTNGTYTFGTNSTYYYKIITSDTMIPSVTSSNPSAVAASYSKKLSDGFLFRITSVGQGQATITTTAADGRSTSFTAVSSGSVTVPPSSQSDTPSGSLSCDTTHPYTFGSNSTYVYKVTTGDTSAPKAVSSNPSAVSVAYLQQVSGGYLYRISNVGKGTATITTTSAGGSYVAFQATGTAVPGAASIVSDTPANLTMTQGKTYQYKFTVSGSVPGISFTTGNGSVIQTVSVSHSGNNWYCKIRAVGKGRAGVYTTVSGNSPVRQCIVTVA
jgi:GH25 family lysozyme M1 (1,4-beta-N-acetylmuramidase)